MIFIGFSENTQKRPILGRFLFGWYYPTTPPLRPTLKRTPYPLKLIFTPHPQPKNRTGGIFEKN